jgi:hypothetical protein
MSDKELIQEVITFLIDNEQYGYDWSQHIDALNNLINQNKDEVLKKG